ncbi:MAG: ABC transporter permease [Anaerolineae bacterium]|nr:ABC transporter permease [Anaerolineae bacterium]
MAVQDTPSPVLPSDVPAPGAAQRRQRFSPGKLVLDNIALIILAIILGLLAAFVPRFFTERNINNILIQAAPLGLMAIGMTGVLITGGIDLSIPSVMGLSAIFGAMIFREGGSIPAACLVMLGSGTLLGAINGFSVAYLKMIPFVVTLAMMTIATGAAVAITNSVSIPVTNQEFFGLILDRTAGIQRPIWITFLVTIVAVIIMRRHIFGRWLYAVGINAKAARVSGIPTARVIFGAYVISGFLAGMTAIVLSARLGSASANMGTDAIVLDVMSSAVVGGVSIYGGVGGPLGAVLGAIFITIISNSMNMMQVSFFTSLIVKGIVIIGFVAIDSLRRK